jgi:hypothetical protein
MYVSVEISKASVCAKYPPVKINSGSPSTGIDSYGRHDSFASVGLIVFVRDSGRIL